MHESLLTSIRSWGFPWTHFRYSGGLIVSQLDDDLDIPETKRTSWDQSKIHFQRLERYQISNVFSTVWHFPNVWLTSLRKEQNEQKCKCHRLTLIVCWDSQPNRFPLMTFFSVFVFFWCDGSGWVLGVASAGPVGPPSEVGPAEKHRPIGGGLCSAVRWWSSTYTSTSCTVLSPSLLPPGTGRNTWLTHLHQDSHQSESCLCSPQMTIGDFYHFTIIHNPDHSYICNPTSMQFAETSF